MPRLKYHYWQNYFDVNHFANVIILGDDGICTISAKLFCKHSQVVFIP